MATSVRIFVEVRGYEGRVLSLIWAIVETFGYDLARIVGAYADSSEWFLASTSPDDPKKADVNDGGWASEFLAAPRADVRVLTWERESRVMFEVLGGLKYFGFRPLSPPRGLPANISAAIKLCIVPEWDRNASFLSVDQADPLTNHSLWNEILENHAYDAIMRDFVEWIRHLRSYQKTHFIPDPHIRLVFWFYE